ncbi:hypothetical protein D9757_002661 [Collybiopsis confluens]|uniref:Protein EFR3 n=1 Tax=Collybiopsis confluens TaxID=2823264 RepID=A0A8H5HWE8_9AGAR|nr:hypothetical protein D9757_002661 [Collybiopsis confluens]
MNFLFTPNHVQLLNSCYPPASTLLTSGPDFSPNSQELSRLTYYASNHPEKLTKLGAELEKRVKVESRKARSGNIRIRASLLITLAIFRSLAIECRRDIALLSPSLVASVENTLCNGLYDLEVVVRAASVFNAWTTYTNGHLIGADNPFTENYISCLQHLASISSSTAKDLELRNRSRLVGLAAITGALNSEALYNDTLQFRSQVSIIIKPVLNILLETDLQTLNKQAEGIKDTPKSPYLAEFRTRPTIERRAASIHIHVDGENGPSKSDVSNAALHAFSSFLSHVNGSQLGHIMRSSFDSLDRLNGWSHVDHCCWFALKSAEWAQYQHRYAVPTWLVERLSETQDTSNTTEMQHTLTAMVANVFNSPVPLINLSTSDILTNLLSLLLRRVSMDCNDAIIPSLIQCVSSLGRHVYYSDQIHDLAAELISRVSIVEMQGVSSRNDSAYQENRAQALRYLIISLAGLINAADDDDLHKTQNPQSTASAESKHDDYDKSDHQSRRTRVPPDIWQDTLNLLLDADFGVRADYADALVFYLAHEMPKRGDLTDVEPVMRARRVDGIPQQPVQTNTLLHSSDTGFKFLHGLHAVLFILASTKSLDLLSTSDSSPRLSTDNPIEVHVEPASPLGETHNLGEASSQYDRRAGITHHSRTRKIAFALSRLDKTQKLSTSTSATISDYLIIQNILMTVHQQLPIRGLIAGVPMLLALDDLCRQSESDDPDVLARVHVIRYALANIWLALGKGWGSSEITSIAAKALASFPQTAKLPDSQATEIGTYHPPPKSAPLSSPESISEWSGLDCQVALSILVSEANIQQAVGLDREQLLSWLSEPWTAERALDISVERPSTYEATLRGDGVSPLLKILPGLMHIENISLQSLARSNRGVGVTELREALEGRSSMSNPNLAQAASISTLDHGSSILGGESRLTQTRSRTRNKKHTATGGTAEVRDVLNKLGLGKQNSSLLKASFPALQSEQRTSVMN